MDVAMLAANPVTAHGWGRYARELIKALADVEPEVRTHLIGPIDGCAPAELDLPVIGYERVLPSLTPSRRLSTARLLSAVFAVRRLAAKCDLVHVLAEPYAVAALACRQPLVVTAHGTYLPQTACRQGVVGLVYRRAYRRARITAVSRYTARQVERALSLTEAVGVIPNGVDVTRFETEPRERAEKRGPTILAVGQIKARKGFHILAGALKAIRAAVPDAEAVFIGDVQADPAYVASVRARLEADGTADAVRWLGRVPERVLLGWLAAADVFALPALNSGERFEGFGLVYLEASAAGLPVIGTRDCGAEDAIREGETGLLVPQNDPRALAAAVIRLLRDAGLRAQMRAAGRRYAATHTWRHVARWTAALYRDLR